MKKTLLIVSLLAALSIGSHAQAPYHHGNQRPAFLKKDSFAQDVKPDIQYITLRHFFDPCHRFLDQA